MTAPSASRHSVAVSRRLYSRGSLALARAAARISKLDSPRRHQLLEDASARLEVLELVERRARGRQQHDLAAAGGACRRVDGAVERAAALAPDDRFQPLGLLADEVHARAALGDRDAERLVGLALAPAAEEQADRGPETLHSPERRG